MRQVLMRCLLLKAEETGERSLVLVMGGFYLLFAMMVLVVDEETLETGNIPHTSLVRTKKIFLIDSAMDSDPHRSAVICFCTEYGSGSRSKNTKKYQLNLISSLSNRLL
jgi:hypothetical protein